MLYNQSDNPYFAPAPEPENPTPYELRVAWFRGFRVGVLVALTSVNLALAIRPGHPQLNESLLRTAFALAIALCAWMYFWPVRPRGTSGGSSDP